MRILFVTGYFPPYSPSAGVRVGKLARYWLDKGHDVHVIGACIPRLPPVLPLEIPKERVSYVDFFDWLHLPDKILGRRQGTNQQQKSSNAASTSPQETAPAAPWRRKLAGFYGDLVEWPDRLASWRPAAFRAAMAKCADWRPDIIYATSPPHSALMVASRLSLKLGVPWIAEQRDLWTENVFLPTPWWRQGWERRTERRVLNSAAGHVTVTPAWAALLRSRYAAPVALSCNGYDPEDFDGLLPTDLDQKQGPRLTLYYAGDTYGGQRGIAQVLRAMMALPDSHLVMRTMPSAGLLQQLAQVNLGERVEVRPFCPRTTVLQEEVQADVLLLLRAAGDFERDTIPGKLFEYIGAGRPILVVGRTDGAVADIVTDYHLGLVCAPDADLPGALVLLASWAQSTAFRDGLVRARRDYERSVQFSAIDGLLDVVAAATGH